MTGADLNRALTEWGVWHLLVPLCVVVLVVDLIAIWLERRDK